MVTNRWIPLFFMIAALGCGVTAIRAGAVSEEAQRHFNRGMAAVEMAKTPEDYDLAIEEFQQALLLAPDWPEVYFNLGLIQEKTGKHREAVDSLRKYLQLEPDAPEAAEIRTLIDKAEFKAEQALTEEDVLNIFASLVDNQQWRLKGITKANLFNKDRWVRSIKREGASSLRMVFPSGHCGHNGSMDQSAMLSGKTIEFGTAYCQCQASTDPEMCADGRRYFLEVVSRNKVKMRIKYWYPKIMGGGTDEGLFEFNK